MSGAPERVDREPRIGGMALANGLLVHGPSCWAIAVRRPDGEVSVTSGTKPRLPHVASRIPVVRGVVRLAEALAVVPVSRMRSPDARLAIEEPATAVTMGATALGMTLARRRLRSVVGQELVSAVGGIAPTVALLSRSDAAMWHAVEHKSIAAYEHAGAAGVGNARDYAKEHPRCGSNLVLPLLASSLAANVGMRRLRRGGRGGRLAATTVASGVAVELFAFAARNPGHVVSRVVHRAGHTLQARWVTKEPSAVDLDVGRLAMEELLRVERDARAAA